MLNSFLRDVSILLGLFCAGIAILVVMNFHLTIVHADNTPAGTRPATAADLDWMRAAGIPNPTVGMPVDPSNPSIGQTAGEAKIWLSQHATKNSNIGCMDAQFAEKLKKFMEAVPGGVPKITDAYRPPEAQNALVASGASRAGPCVSYHNYGLGADFNENSSQQTQWMRSNASAYGIGTIGAWDPNHFQNGSGKYGQCGVCNGSNGYSGTQPGQAGGIPLAPAQTPLQAMQSFFSPPQPQQCPQGYMMMNGTCLPPQAAATQQTSNPYSYLSPPPPPPPTSSYLPNTGGGSTGGANTSNPNGSTPININDNSNTNISDIINGSGSSAGTNGQTNSSTSAIDLINAIANPTSTADGSPQTPTGTPVTLVSSLNNSVTLHGSSTSLNPSWQSSSTYALSPGASQTFVSQDLSQTPTSLQPIQPVNSTFAILENIKQTLLQILAYLKPFGGTTPRSSTAHDSTTAYLE